MQTDEVTVRVQTLGGTWETLGVDRMAGVYPEPDSLELSANSWGSDKASFDLHRDPGAIWPDLAAWTPVEITVGGLVVWTGRISETPTTEGDDRVINVQAEGWQYHLDDDTYDKVYAHTSLTDWIDARQVPAAHLATMVAGMGVTVGDGAITLAWPNGTPALNNTGAAVTLDLGPNSGAIAISADIQSSFNSTAQLYLIGHDDPAWSDDAAPTTRVDWVGAQPLNAAPWTAASQTVTFTPAAASRPFRYVTILLWTAAAGGTPTADIWLKIVGFRAYGSASYQIGGNSILTADMVIKDALTHTPLLSADRSGVTAPVFDIPEFVVPVTNPQTPREVWTAANAFHNYISKIDVYKRPIFKVRPSVPKYEIGAWAGSEFQDASANSGDDVFNAVTVTGTGPDGTPISSRQWTAGLSDALLVRQSSPAVPNPSADVDATGWTVSTQSVARDTTTFDTSPGSFKWGTGVTSIFYGSTAAATFSGTFQANTAYVLRFAMKYDTSGTVSTVEFGHNVGTVAEDWVQQEIAPNNTWQTFTLLWVPAQDYTSGVSVRFHGGIQAGAVPKTIWWDSVYIYKSSTTLADRRNFTKSKVLQIQSPLTDVVAQQIGGVWLEAHKTTPFKGSMSATGHGAVREALTGSPVHPARLLLDTGELIRLSDHIDPDTGAIGRSGLIANVRYQHAARKAQIDLDNSRDNIDAFLARLAVVTGAALGH